MTELKTKQGWCIYKHIDSATLVIVEHRSRRLARVAFHHIGPKRALVSPDGLRRVEFVLPSNVSEFAVEKMCDHLGVPNPLTEGLRIPD